MRKTFRELQRRLRSPFPFHPFPAPPLLCRVLHEDDWGRVSCRMMPFLGESKLLFGAVGIAVSSAALGFLISRGFKRGNSFNVPFKVISEHSPVTKYVLEHGIREPLPLMKLRQVRNLSHLKLATNSFGLISHSRYLANTLNSTLRKFKLIFSKSFTKNGRGPRGGCGSGEWGYPLFDLYRDINICTLYLDTFLRHDKTSDVWLYRIWFSGLAVLHRVHNRPFLIY